MFAPYTATGAYDHGGEKMSPDEEIRMSMLPNMGGGSNVEFSSMGTEAEDPASMHRKQNPLQSLRY